MISNYDGPVAEIMYNGSCLCYTLENDVRNCTARVSIKIHTLVLENPFRMLDGRHQRM